MLTLRFNYNDALHNTRRFLPSSGSINAAAVGTKHNGVVGPQHCTGAMACVNNTIIIF